MSNDTINVNGPVRPEGKDVVEISIVKIEGSDVTIKYNTLYGNSPNANKNYIGLWKSNKGSIPPNTKAKAAYAMQTTTTSSNDYTLYDLPIDDNEYILGYCQTGNPAENIEAAKNVSALAIIAAAEAYADVINCMDLEIAGNSTSITVKYKILRNMDRSAHWFGIWNANDTIGTANPKYAQKITVADEQNTGRIILNEVANLQQGHNYNLAYFANGFDVKATTHMVGLYEFSV